MYVYCSASASDSEEGEYCYSYAHTLCSRPLDFTTNLYGSLLHASDCDLLAVSVGICQPVINYYLF